MFLKLLSKIYYETKDHECEVLHDIVMYIEEMSVAEALHWWYLRYMRSSVALNIQMWLYLGTKIV